jgi:hypothetical protein
MSYSHQHNGGYSQGGYHISGPDDDYVPSGPYSPHGGPPSFSHSGDLEEEDLRNMEEIERVSDAYLIQ